MAKGQGKVKAPDAPFVAHLDCPHGESVAYNPKPFKGDQVQLEMLMIGLREAHRHRYGCNCPMGEARA